MGASSRVIGDGAELIPRTLPTVGGAAREALARATLARGWPVLVVTADRGTRRAAVAALRRAGLAAFTSRTSSVCARIEKHGPGVLVLDLAMPDLQGFRILQEVHEAFEGRVPVVALTRGENGTPTPRGWDWGLGRQGLGGYVEAPFSADHLAMVVYQVLVRSFAARHPRLRHLSGKEIPLEEMQRVLRSEEALELRAQDALVELRRRLTKPPPSSGAEHSKGCLALFALLVTLAMLAIRAVTK